MLRTSEETVVSFWLPAAGVVLVLAGIVFIILRNHKRAKAHAAGVPDHEREHREASGLSARERERLRDELEAYDS